MKADTKQAPEDDYRLRGLRCSKISRSFLRGWFLYQKTRI